MEDLNKMSTSYKYRKDIDKKLIPTKREIDKKYKKRLKQLENRFHDTGFTGHVEGEKKKSQLYEKWAAEEDKMYKDWHRDLKSLERYGKDAPKGRSFSTPKSPKKSPPKSPSASARKSPSLPSGRASPKRNPTPYSDEILKGAGKHKGGGSVRKSRGMGAALRGGGAVTKG